MSELSDKCNHETGILNKTKQENYIICIRCNTTTKETEKYQLKQGVMAEVYQRDGHYKRHRIYTKKEQQRK